MKRNNINETETVSLRGGGYRAVRVAAVVLAAVAAAVALGSTLGKYLSQTEHPFEAVLTGFEVKAAAFVGGERVLPNAGAADGTTLIDDTVVEIGADGTMLMTAAQYEELSLRLAYKGTARSRVRVRVTEQWLNITTQADGVTVTACESVPMGFSEYTFADDTAVADNRAADGWIYLVDEQLCTGTDMLDEQGFKDIGLITAAAATPYTPGVGESAAAPTHVRVSVVAEAVQFNRFAQLWGIDELPTRTNV